MHILKLPVRIQMTYPADGGRKMAICNSCGAHSDYSKYCPNCGMIMPSGAGEIPEQDSTGDSTGDNSFIPAKGHASDGDLSGESPAQLPPDVERIRREYVALPDSSGQTIFTVINIIAGILLICIGGFISLIFSIIAAVHISKCDKAQTREEAEDALGVAKIMNIVAAVALLLSCSACIILVVMLSII